MNVSEKAAYIKGLIEGLAIDTTKAEGKVIAAMADLLEDISLSILDLEDETATLGDYIEEIDEDLGAVEEELYCDDDYCDCCDCCDDYDECDCCDCCDDDDDDEDYDCDCCDCDCECLELLCPACNEPVYIDECDIDKIDELECPSCGKVLQLVEVDDECCDCCDCEDAE